jgi:hypothetical protein
VHVTDGKDLQEADDEIQRLNELGLREDISSDEFLEYFKQLPTNPDVDTYAELDHEKLTAPLHSQNQSHYLLINHNKIMHYLHFCSQCSI